MRTTYVLALVTVAIVAAEGRVVRTQDAEEPVPRRDEIVERTGIELQLIDVEVRDKQGRPVRGLRKEDFEVWIDARRAEIYSVDDLCGCPDLDEPMAAEGDGERSRADRKAPVSVPTAPADGSTREPTTYVLYFDFSQLQMDGRVAAFAEAHRWIDEALPPTAEALIAGYHSVAGLVELAPRTSDRSRLHAALTEAFDDADLVDPFPSLFATRVSACGLCCQTKLCSTPCKVCCFEECWNNARREEEHGRRSYRALSHFLQTMESIPGRKALILFYQNLTTFPGRYWPLDDFDVRDHLMALEQVGADATQSRTALYAAFVGNPLSPNNPAKQAVNVGANLADFTGGAYTRAPGVLAQMTDALVRDCVCSYRIALIPRGGADNKVHRVRVEVRGESIPFRYRAQFLDETGRWWREAQVVLNDPTSATDVTVRSALMPAERGPDGWSVTAQVALDPRSLMTFPRAGELEGAWEVGALLNREDGQAWEMLAVSSLSARNGISDQANVLHEHRFDRLPGGTYHISAFVRDTTANAFGGGAATLELPRPGRPGLVGPVALEADRVVLASTLPIFERKKRKRALVEEDRNNQAERGPLPLSDVPLIEVDRIILRSWICPESEGGAPHQLVRWVSLNDEPLFRFDEAELTAAGDCRRLDDPIETAILEPGSYTYHLRVVQHPDSEPSTASYDFVVALPEEVDPLFGADPLGAGRLPLETQPTPAPTSTPQR